MSTRPSSYREAREDCLVTHSRGNALVELGEFYRLPWPQGYLEADWRQGLYSVAHGPRTQKGGLHAFLEAVMDKWVEEVEIEIRPTSKTRIYSLDHAFVQNDVGRLIRIEGHGLFYSVGPTTVRSSNSNPVAGAWLDLSPWGGSPWDPASFSVAEITRATARILPFVICPVQPSTDENGRAYGGVPCQIHIWICSGRLSPTPANYIQPSALPRSDLTQSPEGGELLESLTDQGNQARGPWPFYIGGDGLTSLRESLERVVAGGVTVRVYRPTAAPSWLPDKYNRRH